MTELILFASVFVSVFALGVQSLNVNNGHYLAAFLTSFVIGTSHLALYRYMPNPAWTEVAAYLLGGPFGIVAAMRWHRWFFTRRRRRVNINCGADRP